MFSVHQCMTYVLKYMNLKVKPLIVYTYILLKCSKCLIIGFTRRESIQMDNRQLLNLRVIVWYFCYMSAALNPFVYAFRYYIVHYIYEPLSAIISILKDQILKG